METHDRAHLVQLSDGYCVAQSEREQILAQHAASGVTLAFHQPPPSPLPALHAPLSWSVPFTRPHLVDHAIYDRLLKEGRQVGKKMKKEREKGRIQSNPSAKPLKKGADNLHSHLVRRQRARLVAHDPAHTAKLIVLQLLQQHEERKVLGRVGGDVTRQ
jgi:hypothetical protein